MFHSVPASVTRLCSESSANNLLVGLVGKNSEANMSAWSSAEPLVWTRNTWVTFTSSFTKQLVRQNVQHELLLNDIYPQVDFLHKLTVYVVSHIISTLTKPSFN